MTMQATGNVSTATDPQRWPAVARVPRGPVSMTTGRIADGLLRQIDRALEKINEGTYGVCDVSGEEIPIKRLEAVPYAVMTVKSQERWEKGLV